MRKKAKLFLLYPILFYLIISVEITLLFVLGIDTDTQWVWVLTTGFVTALLIVVALAAKPSTPKEGIFLGFVWAAVFLLLDLLIVALPFTGLDYFMDFRAWIPYILGIVIAFIVGIINSKKQ